MVLIVFDSSDLSSELLANAISRVAVFKNSKLLSATIILIALFNSDRIPIPFGPKKRAKNLVVTIPISILKPCIAPKTPVAFRIELYVKLF